MNIFRTLFDPASLIRSRYLQLAERLTVLLAVVALMGVTPVMAQSDGSPYSKFGYGLLRDHATSMQRQMGGIGYAMNSGRQINVMNPAAYAFTDSMTFLFDMGMDLQARFSRENGNRESRWGGGLDNVTMQFPISSRMGGSLGLLPYSQIGYDFGAEVTNSSGEVNGAEVRKGQGSLSQFYVGYGARPLDNLSLGFNFSYMFGNLVNDLQLTTLSGNRAMFEQVMQVRDWHLQLGAQYMQRLNPDDNVTLGLTYSPGKSLHGTTWINKYDMDSDVDANGQVYPDTVLPDTKMRSHFSIPATYGAGISYTRGEKLFVEADFTYQQWSKAKFMTNESFGTTRMSDRYKISAGVQYVPYFRGSYMRRVAYRAGAFFERDYIMIGDNHVNSFGLSAGFGFPALNGKTLINLGFEYRHRQATPASLIKEDYLGVTLGVNFNEVWFFRRRIN